MEEVERESMEFDVVIVGAGPAGLSAAIRLKQVNPELSVVVLEKGSEVGAHILSGAVVDPAGIDALLPDWRSDDTHPFKTPVTDDQFLFMTKDKVFNLPHVAMPKLLSNHGNYIVSLGNVCRWLAGRAEALGRRMINPRSLFSASVPKVLASILISMIAPPCRATSRAT